MNDYLTKDGVPVRLADRTCNDCPMLRANTSYAFGKQITHIACHLSGLRITPTHKACILYPKEMGWKTLPATPLSLSAE